MCGAEGLELTKERCILRSSRGVVKLPRPPLAFQRLDHRPDGSDPDSTGDEDASFRRLGQRKIVPGARDLDPLSDTQMIMDVTGCTAAGVRFLHPHDVSIAVCRPIAERVRPADAVG